MIGIKLGELGTIIEIDLRTIGNGSNELGSKKEDLRSMDKLGIGKADWEKGRRLCKSLIGND